MPIHPSHRVLPALVLVALAACARDATGPGDSGGPPPLLTALPRQLTTAETKVRDAANAFSFAWWRGLNAAQRDTSVFVSPLSASFALGMTMNGAAGTTWDEMHAALRFGGASQQEINSGYQSLIALLTSLDSSVTTLVANSIWYRSGFAFLQSFFDTTRVYFDAEVRGLNFADAAGSLGVINGWVNTNTNGKIPTILNEIRPEDVMFLINAIYFKGSWRTKFDADKTMDATFYGAEGTLQQARLMHRLDSMAYAETATYQAVDLPYGNGAFTMTVLLPKGGTHIETLAASLTSDFWDSLGASFRTTKVELFLPKLQLRYERTLNDDLRALGMRASFVPDGADFTRMAAAPVGYHLYLDFVKQKTFVDVHEEGTEAAAATAVGIGVTSVPVIPVMRVDRPYLFVLRERLSGAILFMGKVVRMPA
jgi:serpin B